MLMYTNLTMHH